jgi:AAA domain
LAAIGAGGVLRDIEASYGVVRLTELHRFADPAEAAATLALRDGRPEALGFYLDRRRVHVGDPTTTLDAVFNASLADRNLGLDAIMLAPTRELVSRLNQRAQDHRLAGATPRRQVELGDGNRASVGDLIISRSNDRRLRITATDWVKNGDLWAVLNLTRTGGLRVRHVRNGRTVTLTADYVRTYVELATAAPCTQLKVSSPTPCTTL